MATPEAEDRDEPLEPAPPEARRAWIRAFFVGFLGLQLLIPATYYASPDPFDERFSWRMFSAVRVMRCRPDASETTVDGARRPVALQRVVHQAWITNLSRNRADVIRSFLERRCDEEGVASVTLVNQCIDASGARMDPLVWQRDCEAGDTTEPDDAGEGP